MNDSNVDLSTPNKDSQLTSTSVKKLSREDVLALEVVFLKIQNLQLQANALVNDHKKCQEMISGYQKDLRDLRDRLSAKYDIDLAKADIGADGVITPKG